GLAARDPQQASELDLFILGNRPAQELELPVGTASDVEHAIGSTPLVDNDQTTVVGQGLFARWCRADQFAGAILIRSDGSIHSIETDSFPLGSELEAKREWLVVSERRGFLPLDDFAMLVADCRNDRFTREPDRRDTRGDHDGSRLEIGLTD